MAGQGQRLWVEYLPGYTSELNAVEYIWGYWKQHALPPERLLGLGPDSAPDPQKDTSPSRLITVFWH